MFKATTVTPPFLSAAHKEHKSWGCPVEVHVAVVLVLEVLVIEVLILEVIVLEALVFEVLAIEVLVVEVLVLEALVLDINNSDINSSYQIKNKARVYFRIPLLVRISLMSGCLFWEFCIDKIWPNSSISSFKNVSSWKRSLIIIITVNVINCAQQTS